MKDFIVGLVAAGLGLALVFYGYKVARVLIPIWGFFVGFIMGASGVSDALNNGFVGSTMGIVVGLILGLVFALLAYFFFSLSIILLGATFGYWLGTGMVTALGLQKGFISATIGIILGVVIAVIAIVVNAPKYYLVVVSAFAGAVAILGGILLIINKVQLESLTYTLNTPKVSLPFYWGVGLVVITVIGIIYQLKDTKNQEIDKWGTPFADQSPKQIKSKVV